MFSPQSYLRHAVTDTFAIVVYCFIMNMCIEVFPSKMGFEQSFYSRLIAILVNILITWPYGMYHDLFMRVARKASLLGWMKNLADITAYVTFQSPVYVVVLLVVSTGWYQIMAAISSSIVVSMLMGAVYGCLLDCYRWLFKVNRYQQVKARLFFSRLASPVAPLTGFVKRTTQITPKCDTRAKAVRDTVILTLLAC